MPVVPLALYVILLVPRKFLADPRNMGKLEAHDMMYTELKKYETH